MEIWKDARVFLGLPLFHMAGQMGLFAVGVTCNTTLVLGPDVPITAELVDAVQIHGNVQGTVLPPSLLEDIAKILTCLEHVNELKWVSYAGGPLSQVRTTAYVTQQHELS